MLREIRNVRQEQGTGRRRWFESDGLDLVVWFDATDKIVGFQLCYVLGRGEYALTWRAGTGFAHSDVDTGDDSPLKNRTPILMPPKQGIPWAWLQREFDARSGSLEPELRQLIRSRIAVPTAAGARSTTPQPRSDR